MIKSDCTRLKMKSSLLSRRSLVLLSPATQVAATDCSSMRITTNHLLPGLDRTSAPASKQACNYSLACKICKIFTLLLLGTHFTTCYPQRKNRACSFCSSSAGLPMYAPRLDVAIYYLFAPVKTNDKLPVFKDRILYAHVPSYAI